jgi:hypothetical protein
MWVEVAGTAVISLLVSLLLLYRHVTKSFRYTPSWGAAGKKSTAPVLTGTLTFLIHRRAFMP